MVEFEEYVKLMSELLDLGVVKDLDAESSLYEDWGIDSLQAFELIIMTEQLAGLSVPPLDVPAMFSLGDAYQYYEQCSANARRADD